MKLYNIFLIIIFILINEYNAQTNCSGQLYNYYRSKGMPANTTELNVINLTQGNVSGTTYVDALYLFQSVARIYQTILDNGSTTNADNVFVNTFSVDIPWCTIEIDMTCIADFVACCIAKPNCTDLNDFDLGGSNPIAGRMLIYPDQSPPCNGVSMIRWWNTELVGGFPGNNDQYTFDNFGIQNFIKPTYMPTTSPTPFPTNSPTAEPTFEPTEVPTAAPTSFPTVSPTASPTLFPIPTPAPSNNPTKFPTKAPTKFPTQFPTNQPTISPTISPTSAPTIELTAALTFSESELNYRFSTCTFNNGSVIFQNINQTLFRCIFPQIGCNTSRSNGVPSKRNVPLPSYACFINATLTGGSSMIWQFTSLARLNTYDGFFGASFYISNLPPITVPTYANQIIVAGTRRQYQSFLGTGFNQMANVFYPPFNPVSTQVQYTPNYIYSHDPIIRTLPCICGFSVDCDSNGNFLLEQVVISQFLQPGNQIPRCVTVGGESVVLPLHSNNNTLILNGSTSSDPDGPGPLTFLWKLYTKPIGSPTVIIPNITSPINIIDTSLFVAGTYSFLLYVSDGLNVPIFCFANYTFEINVVTAVVANDFTIGIITCAAGNSTFIPLNGTLSWETNNNFTLMYAWTQFLGWPVTPNTFNVACGNYTIGLFGANLSLAYFVTNHIGLYGFNLTVCDGVTPCSSATIYVRVVPETIQPVPPPITIPNFTQPPIRNFSQPPREIINFTPIPTSLSPTNPTPPVEPTPPTPPIEPTIEPTSAPTPNATPVPPLFPMFPVPTKTDQFIIIFFWVMLILLLVLFFGLWIAEFPFESYNFYDRIRYYV